MNEIKFILASGSPRRRELLTWAGLDFEVFPSQADEQARPGEDPVSHVRRLALDKALDVARRFPGRCILAADTIVVLDGRIMGKPVDAADAEDMLGCLSGRIHQVYTGFCLLNDRHGVRQVAHVGTDVTFRELTKADIGRYIDTGEPMDKAGAYAIQGIGAALIASMSGSYTNVIGLPLPEVLACLRHCGFMEPAGEKSVS